VIINPASLRTPRGYNNGVVVGPGRILFVAGQIGWDENGNLAPDFVSQFDRALLNILEVVRAAGGEAENIGRFTIFVKNKQQYLRFRNEIGQSYRARMGKHFPAMSLLVVSDLLEEGALVEIEATAVLS
jgi:enamine deaminase RidA (YjgF/YER057c/UK114 family)